MSAATHATNDSGDLDVPDCFNSGGTGDIKDPTEAWQRERLHTAC